MHANPTSSSIATPIQREKGEGHQTKRSTVHNAAEHGRAWQSMAGLVIKRGWLVGREEHRTQCGGEWQARDKGISNGCELKVEWMLGRGDGRLAVLGGASGAFGDCGLRYQG
jgi:hypothetical protein